MKKILVFTLVLALSLGIGATAYASTSDSDLANTVREFAGNFRNGFGLRNGTGMLDKDMLNEFKDLTSEEQLELLEDKLANEEITEAQYDILKLMIENECTFDPTLDGTGLRGQNGFGMGNGIRIFDKDMLDEFKDLTSEEQLSLLEEKLANEEITQAQYDRLALMIENECTFDPTLDGTGTRNGKGSRIGNGMKNGMRSGKGMGMRNGGGNRFNTSSEVPSEDIGKDL